MKIAIIVSNKDPAGITIKNSLLKNYTFKQDNNVFTSDFATLYELDEYTVYAEDLDKKIDADMFIFATRHQSKQGVPSLSCHSPGNWSSADFGGKPRTLSIAPASYLKAAYFKLKEASIDFPNHQITLEVTHHGPTFKKPIMFIEIGSSQEHWQDKKAGDLLAKIIVDLIKNKPKQAKQTAIAIGGPHYCNNFNKVLERHDIAIGHICPKHQLEHLTLVTLKQSIENTLPKPDIILLDWKGLGSHKEKIKEITSEIGLKVLRTDKV